MTSGVVVGRAKPRGRFPHYRRAGDFVFISGTSARRADNSFTGGEMDAMGVTRVSIKDQTRAVIENICNILADAGLTVADLVEVSCFLVNMHDFGGFNEVWSEYFDETGPTRTTVAVHQLPHPLLLIEMKAVAWSPARGGTESQ